MRSPKTRIVSYQENWNREELENINKARKKTYYLCEWRQAYQTRSGSVIKIGYKINSEMRPLPEKSGYVGVFL